MRATGRLRRSCFAVAASLFAAAALAAGLDGPCVVRSADLRLQDGVYRLDARLDLPVGAAVRRGLADGVPLSLAIDIEITRVRRFLPDADIADLTQHYHLQYNAVSARYILRNDNSGQQQSLPTAEAAIAEMSVVHDLPVLDKSLVPPGSRYEANVRATVDYGTVPMTLRILMFWVSEWHRESSWYTWTLKR
ncbi:MAG: DUF4390 domain-containing protein [Steroidobacteraceae bacterium]|nr:DUF4390 domain-containing protein [Steroidobacteraceae bacterium]